MVQLEDDYAEEKIWMGRVMHPFRCCCSFVKVDVIIFKSKIRLSAMTVQIPQKKKRSTRRLWSWVPTTAHTIINEGMNKHNEAYRLRMERSHCDAYEHHRPVDEMSCAQRPAQVSSLASSRHKVLLVHELSPPNTTLCKCTSRDQAKSCCLRRP